MLPNQSPSPRVSFSCKVKAGQGPHLWVTEDELDQARSPL